MRIRAGAARPVIGVLFAALLYLVPLAFAGSPYVLFALTLTLCYAILGIALNLLLGYTGLVSLGHMGFAGVGAYVTAILMKNGIASFAP
ncbi:MAG: ABC transporter permease subunit, partial [Xanthobacteraceae bacterium]